MFQSKVLRFCLLMQQTKLTIVHVAEFGGNARQRQARDCRLYSPCSMQWLMDCNSLNYRLKA